MKALQILIAFFLPWLLLEAVLAVGGYEPPDNRRRLALFPDFPDFYEPDRDLGWQFKPNLVRRAVTAPGRFRTDAAGHRRTKSATPPKGPPVVDCLGDSSTFGFLVPDHASYPSRLQERLGRPVRNLGVPGYNAVSIEQIALEREDPAPVTLVMVGFNDHFPSSRTADAELRLRRVAYFCFASRACSWLFDQFASSRTQPGSTDDDGPFVPLPAYRRSLENTIRTLREKGSEPVLLVYPSLVRDEKTRAAVAAFWKQPRSVVDRNYAAHPQYQAATRDIALDHDVAVVDLHQVFRRAGNRRLHLDWVHPNARGYRLMADTVAPVVRRALAARRRAARSESAARRP